MYRVFSDAGTVEKVTLGDIVGVLDMPSDYPTGGLVLEGDDEGGWTVSDGDEVIAIVVEG